MANFKQLMEEHTVCTRRYFLQTGTLCAASFSLPVHHANAALADTDIEKIQAELEYLTPDSQFINFGRGNPPPYTLPIEKRREVGLTPETWQLEISADPESNSEIEQSFTKENGNAIHWQTLMDLGKQHAVRFLSAVSCTNGSKPCGMALWEGVPLRTLIQMAGPKKNIRRVFYYGYHNDDPKQRFQSSLTLSRVLEDPPGELPVILCYKLNNEWLSAIRGGPVRIVVPGLYGNKSVKWVQTIVLTNNYQVNDTYALWNNDTESPLKTRALFVNVPTTAQSANPICISGMAQSGMSGLAEVQYCLHPKLEGYPENDPYYSREDWKRADILPPPDNWGGGLPDGKLPPVPLQIDPTTGKPHQWPLRNTLVHWAAVLRDIKPGDYDILCRTIDKNGTAQPMPRPYLKSGYNAIQKKSITVEV